MSLTNKQRVFIDEYLISWNATEAARKAGYSFPNVEGPKNLVKPSIAVEIRQRINEKAMTADEVLTSVAEIGRGDLSRYITRDGEINIQLLREDGQGHLLKKYKRTRRIIRQKDGGEIETESTEAELYAADAAHDKLMRYHGLYNDKTD